MPRIPSTLEKPLLNRIRTLKKEIEVLKASADPGRDKLLDQITAELKSLQVISDASKTPLPIREWLSNKRAFTAVAISIVIGAAGGWLAAKSLTVFSSYDECILNNVKPGTTSMAAGMIRRSCHNIHLKAD